MAHDPVTIKQLLAALRGHVEILEQRGDASGLVQAITDDSRAVARGSLFVAVKGERVDGHGFIDQAIKAAVPREARRAMTGMHLVVQGVEVATGDLKALAALCRCSSIERVTGNAFRILNADPLSREAVASHCEGAALDWGFVPDGRRLADFGLLALDMDSTLITVECIDEIADFAGRKAEVAAVTAAAMRGEIDWPQSLRSRVAALAGLEESVLDRVYRERLHLTPGAEPLLAAARRAGHRHFGWSPAA